MGDLPGFFFDSWATGTSADGAVIVGLGSGPSERAFRWTASTGMVDLGTPPGGTLSEAWGVSADGSVVVGDAGLDGEFVPTIWDEAHGMKNLEDVLAGLGLEGAMQGWDLEQAMGVSADGLTVTGWGYNPDGFREAWIADLSPPSVVEIPAASNVVLILFAALLVAAGFVSLRSH